MLSIYEHRKRTVGGLYRVRSYYLFGCVLVFRRWEQMTVKFATATEDEINSAAL